MQMDHINISCSPDLLERVKEFYCALLGFEDGYRPNFSSPGCWLYASGTPVIHLSVNQSRAQAQPTGCLDHVAFRVSDLTPIMAALEKHDVDFGQVRIEDIGLTQIFFADPAGIKVEINCADRNDG